ncbi:uncharacterized protein [Excalfactoria chinensis]|uniref:uncharacterized protein isoform X2 n=1 Tax=Excalfactoria chinensis TaxID=46218 RepID=UPI003B3B4A7C
MGACNGSVSPLSLITALTPGSSLPKPCNVTGGGDPGSPLGSGTESLADRMEVPPGKALPDPRFPPALEPSWNPSSLERVKDESERGKYSQGSSRLLKKLLKEMKKAERGMEQPIEQDALQEGSHPTLPSSDSVTEAAPTTSMPGMNAKKSTKAAVDRSVRKRHMMVILKALLLSALVLACGTVLWICKKYWPCMRKERTAEQAHPETDGEGVPTGDECRMELGEAAGENLAQSNENLNNSPRPFCSAIRNILSKCQHLFICKTTPCSN